MHKDPTALWYRSMAVLSFFGASPGNKHPWDHSSPVMSVGQEYRSPQLGNPAVVPTDKVPSKGINHELEIPSDV